MAIEKCETFLAQFNKISREARSTTKQMLRCSDIAELMDNREQDMQLVMFAVSQPKVQKGLEMYLESLKKK